MKFSKSKIQMHPLLEQIFSSKQFTNSRGEIIPVHSETPKHQCEFIQGIIDKFQYRHTVEIGLAFGISSLAILEKTAGVGGSHLAIDKFQTEVWKNNGVDIIRLAGYGEQFTLIEDYSYRVLPRLLDEGRVFDFAYIDSTKQFDWLLVDFFFLDKLVRVNGMIVFDDVTWPGIRKLLRLLTRFPSYEVYDTMPENAPVRMSKLTRWLKKFKPSAALLKEELLISDEDLGINTQCVALRKKDEDRRNWDWHQPF